MKTHIVAYGAYYQATLVRSRHSTFLQYRTSVGDLFITKQNVREFPTRLEAYRYMFFNIKDLSNHYSRRRICYPYDKLTRIMRKHFIEDFL